MARVGERRGGGSGIDDVGGAARERGDDRLEILGEGVVERRERERGGGGAGGDREGRGERGVIDAGGGSAGVGEGHGQGGRGGAGARDGGSHSNAGV